MLLVERFCNGNENRVGKVQVSFSNPGFDSDMRDRKG